MSRKQERVLDHMAESVANSKEFGEIVKIYKNSTDLPVMTVSSKKYNDIKYYYSFIAERLEISVLYYDIRYNKWKAAGSDKFEFLGIDEVEYNRLRDISGIKYHNQIYHQELNKQKTKINVFNENDLFSAFDKLYDDSFTPDCSSMFSTINIDKGSIFKGDPNNLRNMF